MAAGLFPLDVNYNRVAGWLVERHKLPADWLKRHRAIQNKVSEAALELSPGFLSQFPGGEETPLSYFVVKQVRDKLAETSERGLFGRLAGSAGTWDKLVKALEKSLIYLGEAGQTLAKNVDFEIPYLRKQGEAMDKQVSDNERKQADCQKNAASSALAFKKECEHMGIQGLEIRTEVTKYADSVFRVLQVAVEGAKTPGVRSAIDYYTAFTRVVHAEEGKGSELLTTLSKVINDDVEAVQRPKGSGHDGIAGSDSKVEPKEEGGKAEGNEGMGGGEGVTDSPPGPAPSGINWDFDIVETSQQEVEHVDTVGALGADIDWDIDVAIEAEEAGNEGDSSIDWEVVDGNDVYSDQGIEAGHGSGDSEMGFSNAVLRIVWDAKFRSSLLDELMELQAFLLMRKTGLENETTGIMGGEILSDELEKVDTAAAEEMLTAVRNVTEGLTSKEPRQLIMLKTSSRWLEKMVVDLEKRAGQEAKWKKSAAQLDRKHKELQKNLMSNSLKLAGIIKNTKMIKGAVEEAISQQFGGRKINVVGDLSGIL